MAGNKIMVGGTIYEITGGKALINGTSYNITGGKTLIGGVAKTISFRPPQTLEGLFSKATLLSSGGINSKTAGTVSFSMPLNTSSTYYIFTFYNGYMSIIKVVFTANVVAPTSTTLLAEVSSSYCKIFVEKYNNIYRRISLSNNGTAALSANGGTIAAFSFSDYTESEIDYILSHTTFTRVTGRNATSTGNVSANASSYANGKYVIMAFNTYIGISHWTSATAFTAIYGNNTGNPALVYRNGSYCQLSVNGTSSQSAYGASYLTAPY